MSNDWQVVHVMNDKKMNVEEIKNEHPNEINDILLIMVKVIASIKGFEVVLK